MSDSSIPSDLVDQDTVKLRQVEERLQPAFQEQSEMYRTMKSSLCDCSNCISAREESARRRLTDIPKQPDISQWKIPDIRPLFRFLLPSDEAIYIASIFSSN